MIRNPFKRGVSVPDEVVAAAALRPGEKVLAGTRTTDGRWLLGTRDALQVVGTPGAEPGPVVEPVETRIPWEQIERADWDGDAQRLVVVEVGEFGRVQPRHEFPVAEPGLLLELVRERVTASVVLQRRVAVHGKRGLLVIGRRAPGGDGAVSWAYQFDAGVDPEDPAVLAAAEAGLRAAEADLGM
ncbi:MAG: hypothetical protein ACOYX5_18255 [Actinomycetota bacterium]